jgi:hypothetical protein
MYRLQFLYFCITKSFHPRPIAIYSQIISKRVMSSTTTNPSTSQTPALAPEIEEIHRLACQQGLTNYLDPVSGYTVFTEVFHRKRGKCCGNKCRHCPFNHVNVPENRK